MIQIEGKIISATPGKSGISQNTGRKGYWTGKKFSEEHKKKIGLGLLKSNRGKKNRYSINAQTGCWKWLLYIMPNGYGQVWNYRVRKRYLAHRLYYENKFGILPKNIRLDHLCRNRACVNPNHLEATTQQINIQRGQTSKLNPEKIIKIRKLYKERWGDQKQIGKFFGIGADQISRIVNFKCWDNIPKQYV